MRLDPAPRLRGDSDLTRAGRLNGPRGLPQRISCHQDFPASGDAPDICGPDLPEAQAQTQTEMRAVRLAFRIKQSLGRRRALSGRQDRRESVAFRNGPKGEGRVASKPEELTSMRFDEVHEMTAKVVEDVPEIFRAARTAEAETFGKRGEARQVGQQECRPKGFR
jgi:hypothetical protein